MWTSLSCHASACVMTEEEAPTSFSHITPVFKLGTFDPTQEIKILQSFVLKETLRETDEATTRYFKKSAAQIPFNQTLDLLMSLFCGPEKTRQKNIGRLSRHKLLALEETLSQTLSTLYGFLNIVVIDERERLQRERVGLKDKIASRQAQYTYRRITDAFIHLSDAYVAILKAHYPHSFKDPNGLLPQKSVSLSKPLFYLCENDHYLLTTASTLEGPFVSYDFCHTIERNPCESVVLLNNGQPVKEDGIFLCYQATYHQAGLHFPWRMFGYYGGDSKRPFSLADTTQNVTENFFDDDHLIGLSHVPTEAMKLLRNLFARNDPKTLKSLQTNIKDFVALPTTDEDMALFELLCLEDTLDDVENLSISPRNSEVLSLGSVTSAMESGAPATNFPVIAFSPSLALPPLSVVLDDAPHEKELSESPATPLPTQEKDLATPVQAFVGVVEKCYGKSAHGVILEKEQLLLDQIKGRLAPQNQASTISSAQKTYTPQNNQGRRGSSQKKKGPHQPSASSSNGRDASASRSLEERARQELAQMKLKGRIKWQRVLVCINQIRRDMPGLHAHVTVTGSHSVLHFPHEKSLTIAPKHGKQDTTLPAGVVKSFCYELIKRGLGLHDDPES